MVTQIVCPNSLRVLQGLGADAKPNIGVSNIVVGYDIENRLETWILGSGSLAPAPGPRRLLIGEILQTPKGAVLL